MTSFTSDDGIEHFIFGKDGGKNIAQKFNIELLGQIPINIQIRENSDQGTPITTKDNQKFSEIFKEIVIKLIKNLS
jgi:ATP-binding protein involved in chromosome partitioning